MLREAIAGVLERVRAYDSASPRRERANTNGVAKRDTEDSQTNRGPARERAGTPC